MKKLTLSLAAIAILAGAAQANAQENFAVTIGGGTPGGTLEGQYRLNDTFQVRGGVNYFNYDADFNADDTDYTGDLEFSGGGLFVDAHPFDNSFFVTGGAYIGKKAVDLEITSGENLVIGGVTYTPADYGTVVGEAEFEDIAPFLGLGFDTTFTGNSSWGFQLIAGAAYFGSADIELMSVGGTLSDNPIIVDEVERQRVELENEVEDYKIYPILQAGLSYRF